MGAAIPETAAAPEPSTWAMMLFGFVAWLRGFSKVADRISRLIRNCREGKGRP